MLSITSSFSILAAFLAVSASPQPPTLATRATRSNQVIHPAFSSLKCLTAASNSNYAAVEIEDCVPGAANQLWTITDSTVTIFGDKCLDDSDGNMVNGRKLQIYKCFPGNTNQKWTYNNPFFKLSDTSKCMDLTNGNRDNGNVVQLWDCTGGGNQQWHVADGSTVTPPPTSSSSTPTGPTPTIHVIKPIKQHETCLTVQKNENNAPVVVEPCDGSASQEWKISNGKIIIYGNKCLDVTNGSTAKGVKMQVYTCFAGNINQKFFFTTPSEFPDAKQIHWAKKGVNRCLDLTDSNLTDGARMQMWSCGVDNHNQFWDIV